MVVIISFFPLNYLLLIDLYFELSSLSCWVVVFLYGGFLVVILKNYFCYNQLYFLVSVLSFFLEERDVAPW